MYNSSHCVYNVLQTNSIASSTVKFLSSGYLSNSLFQMFASRASFKKLLIAISSAIVYAINIANANPITNITSSPVIILFF